MMRSMVAGVGAPGAPPVLMITVLRCFVVCVTPFAVMLIWSPCTKIPMTVLPSILISAIPPRTETVPVGV